MNRIYTLYVSFKIHLLFSCHPCVTNRLVVPKECYILTSHFMSKWYTTAGPYNFGKQRWVSNVTQLNIINAVVLMSMKI